MCFPRSWIRIALGLAVSALVLPASAQFIRTENTGLSDTPVNIAVDGSGDTFVGDNVTIGGHAGLALMKIGPGGHLDWTWTYDGSAHEGASLARVIVDSVGNVIAVGGAVNDHLIGGLNEDIAVYKLDTTGRHIWTRYYDTTTHGDDAGTDVAVDKANNVFVAGESLVSSNLAGILVSYDVNGVKRWVRERAENGFVLYSKVRCDSSGNAMIAGETNPDASAFEPDALVIKYSRNGAMFWRRTYDAGQNQSDEVYAMAIDASDSVVIGCRSFLSGHDYDIVTVKFSNNGNQLWAQDYNSPLIETLGGLAIDKDGNIVVVGGTGQYSYSFDYLTLKYSPDGDLLWQQTFTGESTGPSQDLAAAVCIDSAGTIYVTGASQGDGKTATDMNLLTLSYSSDGVLNSADAYGRHDGIDDKGVGIVMAPDGHPIAFASVGSELLLIKY